MCRDSHYCAGAVLHQHVVCHVDGDQLTVDRVHGVTPGEDSGLVLLSAGPLDCRGGEGLGHILLYLMLLVSSLHQTFHQRMLRSQDEECSTEQGVRACSCLLYTSPSPRDGLLSRMP